MHQFEIFCKSVQILGGGLTLGAKFQPLDNVVLFPRCPRCLGHLYSLLSFVIMGINLATVAL